MFKNAVIALFATALLFTNTVLAGYGVLAYLAVASVVFAIVCMIYEQKNGGGSCESIPGIGCRRVSIDDKRCS